MTLNSSQLVSLRIDLGSTSLAIHSICFQSHLLSQQLWKGGNGVRLISVLPISAHEDWLEKGYSEQSPHSSSPCVVSNALPLESQLPPLYQPRQGYQPGQASLLICLHHPHLLPSGSDRDVSFLQFKSALEPRSWIPFSPTSTEWVRCKRGHCDFLKIPFILAPQLSREKLTIPYFNGNQAILPSRSSPSPPQALDVLKVADVSHKSWCPELNTDSRQSLSPPAIWTLYPF